MRRILSRKKTSKRGSEQDDLEQQSLGNSVATPVVDNTSPRRLSHSDRASPLKSMPHNRSQVLEDPSTADDIAKSHTETASGQKECADADESQRHNCPQDHHPDLSERSLLVPQAADTGHNDNVEEANLEPKDGIGQILKGKEKQKAILLQNFADSFRNDCSDDPSEKVEAIIKQASMSRYVAAGTYGGLELAEAAPEPETGYDSTSAQLTQNDGSFRAKHQESPLQHAAATDPSNPPPQDLPRQPRRPRFPKSRPRSSGRLAPGAYAMTAIRAVEQTSFGSLAPLQENREQPSQVDNTSTTQSQNRHRENPTRDLPSDDEYDDDVSSMDENNAKFGESCVSRRPIVFSSIFLIVGLAIGVAMGLLLRRTRTLDQESTVTIIYADSWRDLVEYCDSAEASTTTIEFTDEFREQLRDVQNRLSRTAGSGICTPRRMALRSLAFLNYTVDNLLPYFQLLTLFFSTRGQDWTNNRNWLSQEGTYCDWYGINCSNGTTEIRLDDNGLDGSLPVVMFLLRNVSHMSFSKNPNLAGALPTQIGLLSGHLQYLDLGETSMSGTVPSELSMLSQLHHLRIESSFLEGPLPEFGALTKLRTLSLGIETYRAELPEGLEKLTNLNALRISGSYQGLFPPSLFWNLQILELIGTGTIYGTLPAEAFAHNRNWTRIKITNHLFDGSIPTTIGNLHQLEDISLFKNTFGHPIPSELGLCTSLREINIAGNDLEGAIPTTLGTLTKVVGINMESNRLTGTIPSELGMMTNLQGLSLSEQFRGSDQSYVGSFVGTIPSEICQIPSLKFIRLTSCNSEIYLTCPEGCCTCAREIWQE